MNQHTDVLVIGAGAAGLFFAAEAARRGQRVLVLDHAEKIGEKIRISGGGRCNFTNLGTRPDHFLSDNPKFCVSALSRFTAHDFLARIESAEIAWQEKALGQLFCRDSAQQIIDFLLGDCAATGAMVKKGIEIVRVERNVDGFQLITRDATFTAPKLVIATGGKSIPKIGASGFGYSIAEQFGLSVIEPRPALVPLTFDGPIKDMAKALAGVSVEASVSVYPEHPKRRHKKAPATSFQDGFLFTHRGLSGPSVLQISSYWREGGDVLIDLAPGTALAGRLVDRKRSHGRSDISTVLAEFLPRRLSQALCERYNWKGRLADWPDQRLSDLSGTIKAWRVTPSGSEGYRTAEVTLGGVSTDELNSRTMETQSVPGLYFIGEVVDVTGWLGGYNFQWAWSSAYAAAEAVAS